MQAEDLRTRLEILDQHESLRKSIAQEDGKIQKIARKIVDSKVARLYLVGMGSSYSAALMCATLARNITTLTVEVYRGYELEYDNPIGFGGDSCLVAISFSGETEDVVSALKFAKKRQAYTVSVSGPEESTIAREADDAIRIASRDTKAMVAAHLTEVALLYLLVGYVAQYRDGSTKIQELKCQLDELAQRLPQVIAQEEDRGRRLAAEFKDATIFYVISAGPSFGIAYKLAWTELTENVWVHGLAQYSTEFRHGIVEKVEEGLPMIFIIGSDSSQEDIRRELKTCQDLKARTIVWDARDFPHTDDFLAPFYLSIPASWFVYYLALAKGRLPSDRRYMGSVIPYANMKILSKPQP
jgi:glucosamine--fructose-6-phosphate aminotransferase (isomerizing)